MKRFFKFSRLVILICSFLLLIGCNVEYKGKYKITYVDYDGTLLKEEVLYEGSIPNPPSNTVREGYQFIGWDHALGAVTKSDTYIAEYKYIPGKFTIIWANHDGDILKKDVLVEEGNMPKYVGPVPTKKGNDEFTYEFIGWTPSLDVVTEDVTYTAVFKEIRNQYTVTWKRDDGSLLTTTTLEYGQMPKYPNGTPVKEGDAQYSYKFDKWDKEISEVTGNITYVAEFIQSVNEYTVTWKDYDGKVLAEEVLKYGEMPVYPNANPIKEGNAEFTYTFAGWNKAVEVVTKDVTYSATYSETRNKYNVVFDCNNIMEIDKQLVEYGSLAVEPSNIKVPGYEFLGWFVGDEKYDFSTPIKGDLNIIGKFDKYTEGLEYTLSNDGNYYIVSGIENVLEERIHIDPMHEGLPVKEIGDYAFQSCENIKEVKLHDTLTTIGHYAFYYCKALENIELPESVKTIGYLSFAYCESLKTIDLPSSVTSIGSGAFMGCTVLENINISNSSYKTIDGSLYTSDGKTLIQYAIGRKDTSFEISSVVTKVEQYAFFGALNLQTVIIPTSVVNIGKGAFNSCENMSIKCMVEVIPTTWHAEWNSSNRPVELGYTK